jgi:hypothetical protein
MSNLLDVLSGVLRYFPNTMTLSLFVIGMTLGRIPWVLVSIGGVIVAILTLAMQYFLSKAFNIGGLPGPTMIQACSMIPIASGEYSPVPSMWITLAMFYLTYFITNASFVYSAPTPSKVSQNSIQVQQRKSIGIISLLAISLLFFFIVIPRFMTACETKLGAAIGGLWGIGAGVGYWYVLRACNSTLFPDVHGVMLGINPGTLHSSPLVCS